MAHRSIDELCEELEAKREPARSGGGAKAEEKQRQKGKGTARERIARLLDEGSFVEVDEFVQHRCGTFGLEKSKYLTDGVVTGWGTVDGRKVYLYSQDF
ncbi:MAG: carboxyl transferase domain-containing protein, partial [Synergistaceae bacterium]|nr:carboxyl transferase domain-containing protein [Synergistaceae bacterium]